jgi:hypothetical protein
LWSRQNPNTKKNNRNGNNKITITSSIPFPIIHALHVQCMYELNLNIYRFTT